MGTWRTHLLEVQSWGHGEHSSWRYRHVDMEQNIYCRVAPAAPRGPNPNDHPPQRHPLPPARKIHFPLGSRTEGKLGLLPDRISIKESVFENPVLWTLVENIASSSTKQAWYTSSYHTDWGRPLRSHPLEHTEDTEKHNVSS
ncbi:unnamed protein product [Gadus morhua 'NCC']